MIATKAFFERSGLDKRGDESGKPEHFARGLRRQPKTAAPSIGLNFSSFIALIEKFPRMTSSGRWQLLQSEGKINHIGLSEVSVKTYRTRARHRPYRQRAESLQCGRSCG